MTQPTFSPVPAAGEVRPTVPTATPEIGRAPKPGLQRSLRALAGPGYGTPAPGEGFALTIAEHALAGRRFAHEHDRHDVTLGVALVAAKRASRIGRGPTRADVDVALAHFGLDRGDEVGAAAVAFRGLAHSYEAQRRLVDAVDDAALRLA